MMALTPTCTPKLRTWGREYEGAVEAAKKLKLDRVLILTLEEEGEENIEGITLEVKPLWKWLVGF